MSLTQAHVIDPTKCILIFKSVCVLVVNQPMMCPDYSAQKNFQCPRPDVALPRVVSLILLNCRHHVFAVEHHAPGYYMLQKHLHVSWHIQSVLQQQISTPFIGSPTPQSSDRSGLTRSLQPYCSCLEEESPRVSHIICFSLALSLSSLNHISPASFP